MIDRNFFYYLIFLVLFALGIHIKYPMFWIIGVGGIVYVIVQNISKYFDIDEDE